MIQTIHTLQEMHEAGISIAKTLSATDIVTLSGDLGAGKTTLTKGILAYFGIDPHIVTSPTFSIMNVYHPTQHTDTITQIVHIDTYRLESSNELLEIGFDDYVQDQKTITIIEWPEKIEPLLTSLPNSVHSYALAHTIEARTLSDASVGTTL